LLFIASVLKHLLCWWGSQVNHGEPAGNNMTVIIISVSWAARSIFPAAATTITCHAAALCGWLEQLPYLRAACQPRSPHTHTALLSRSQEVGVHGHKWYGVESTLH